MSKELDDLLFRMNELKRGRLESDIGPRDPYWASVNDYRAALNDANGVHIPVGAEVVVTEVNLEDKSITTESIPQGSSPASHDGRIVDENGETSIDRMIRLAKEGK